MKIIIDNIVFYLQKAGGISAVWYELISRLKRNTHLNINLVQYPNEPDNLFYKNFDLSNVKIIKRSCLFKFIDRYLPTKDKAITESFIYHSTYYRYSTNPFAINITTVHDFTYEYFSKGIKKKIHSAQKRKAILNSKYIICISENTKKDLLKFIPEAATKDIRIIYNGVSDEYKVLSNEELSQTLFLPKNDYFLFVGARDGYKNFDFAVTAISQTNYDLVIVGNQLSNNEIENLNEKLGEKRYVYIGRISNEKLNFVYNKAFALLYPSSYEGFGIPIIEAQKSGCPVIAFNGSSITEVIGETPLLLQELSKKEFNRCISLLEDNEKRKEIIIKGQENALRFTWDKMYDEVLNLYYEALSANNK